MENVKNLLKTQNTNLQELVTNLREANTLHVSVLGGPGQADEPADRAERRRARAQVHGEVLHPRPQPAGGGVHQVRVIRVFIPELQTIHQFSQSRRRPLLGPSPG